MVDLMFARLTRIVMIVAAVLLMASACGSNTSTKTSDAENRAQSKYISGEVNVDTVVIDGTPVVLAVIVPADFSPLDSSPVLLALPPGSQTSNLVQSTMRDIYLDQATERGWVVVSPAAPGGIKFFEGSEELIPGLLDYVSTWVSPEAGGFHLSGISNGGISSFRVATEQPERILSIVAFPGFALSDADIDGLSALTEIRVRLFVGGQDTAWIPRMEQTTRTLNDLGGDTQLETFPGEGHIIASLNNGIRIFDELDAAR